MVCTAGGKSPMHMESLGLCPLSPCSRAESIASYTRGTAPYCWLFVEFPFHWRVSAACADIPFILRIHACIPRLEGSLALSSCSIKSCQTDEWMNELVSSGNQEHFSTCQELWGIAAGRPLGLYGNKSVWHINSCRIYEREGKRSWMPHDLEGVCWRWWLPAGQPRMHLGHISCLALEVTGVGNSPCYLFLTLADILGKNKITTMAGSQWGRLPNEGQSLCPKELLSATIKTEEQLSGRKMMLYRVLCLAWAMSCFLGFFRTWDLSSRNSHKLKTINTLSISVLLPSGPVL